MTAPYPRSVKPNYGLDAANVFAIDVGAPALASAARVVTSHAMQNAAFTVANASSADGLPRNVTVTATQQGGSDDTPGTVLVTGTNVDGAVISESLVPANGSTVAGVKAFKTVTSVVQSGWTAAGTADLLTVGFGTKVGFPKSSILKGNGAYAAVGQIILATLGGTIVAANATFNAAIEQCTLDASAGTYDGTKELVALMRR